MRLMMQVNFRLQLFTAGSEHDTIWMHHASCTKWQVSIFNLWFIGFLMSYALFHLWEVTQLVNCFRRYLHYPQCVDRNRDYDLKMCFKVLHDMWVWQRVPDVRFLCFVCSPSFRLLLHPLVTIRIYTVSITIRGSTKEWTRSGEEEVGRLLPHPTTAHLPPPTADDQI